MTSRENDLLKEAVSSEIDGHGVVLNHLGQ